MALGDRAHNLYTKLLTVQHCVYTTTTLHKGNIVLKWGRKNLQTRIFELRLVQKDGATMELGEHAHSLHTDLICTISTTQDPCPLALNAGAFAPGLLPLFA